MSDSKAFRQEIRAWLEENCPESMRSKAKPEEQVWGGRNIQFPSEDARVWFERCVEKGYCVPDWPKEYGGAGFDQKQTRIFQQEMTRLNCRPPQVNLGIWMAGPAILEFGTEEQKREHLPKIARGEIRWCQGYSEPGAGSDLAGLQCKAESDGDEYVINGSKIWTSYADHSDWIYCLVRTDSDAPKHNGITFLLFDMASEGVEAKPIELITGETHFCQTFFDNVRVPKKNALGEENKGWTVAKRVLEFERDMMSDMESTAVNSGQSPRSIGQKFLGDEDGRVTDEVFRHAIAKHEVQRRGLEMSQQRMIDEYMQGIGDPRIAMIFKYVGTEEEKSKYELMVKMAGEHSLGWGEGYTENEIQMTKDWMGAKTHSIAGGTSEIQLNIIAKRALGLPEK
ncbi:acyl-CoA dehydrogenase family protein [Endozoicomonas numazuensis]|uniref:Acyl-CoA dehydrogenase n=1 Tax=Endozoicomonas numazuensis TaxID=1137799 RepID=A0A081NMS3_9GAMM|nr:acyl-CoA dehydrogenase family protein [Endozoicomonas numazuensis]KEQ19746.1 acyl-CoA dehydrogenase [Endozoicomonas numazuensis]